MIKFKHFFYVLIVSIALYSCGDNGTSNVDNFDHAAQALIDNDSLVKFLKNNYYNEVTDAVEVLEDGKTPLYNDDKLVTKEVTENDIKYTLYYYVNRVGTPDPVKGNPTVMDSVLTKYNGKRIVNSKTLSSSFDSRVSWLTLSDVIVGWRQSFIHFKGGKKATLPDGPLNYENGGKGIIFIPSGLAYRNIGNGSIPGNAILMFYIDLWDVIENTDHDRDHVPSIFEDPDGDGNPKNDDTDNDGVPNYLDVDDDNDAVLTKNEDRNKDGDPRNDFNDPNNPTLPDYLNRKIRN
ncbi:FKBP-type peptidyl-prolyl cis-trans isomerase [Tenacibaculum sp. TC6]|uniref:FKBP-type peptidyl-prolyl cis-trans isomerase n=1 Tax=Tenacibaculum sp. TC6 TaxID=3423223 RepID=UPI003D3664FE